ncbi:hypothetical protein ACA910_003060 [Epithemia clementina (nom. ined.)]
MGLVTLMTITTAWWACTLVLTLLPSADCFNSVGTILQTGAYGERWLRTKQHFALRAEKNELSQLVVVSPPGGVGEVVAVKAATMGTTVKWLVVSPPSSETVDQRVVAQDQVVLSQQALVDIDAAGGKVEIARSDAPSVLLSKDDKDSALPALEAWCRGAGGLICTYDTAEPPKKRKLRRDEEERQIVWRNAIKVAAREAAKSVKGAKLAILSSEESVGVESKESTDSIKRAVGSFLGGGKIEIPDSLASAIESATGGNVMFLRYGQLFGTPESSPDFSPLIGGPKKFPELCEEYLMRTVRVDPTLSVSGNIMLSGQTTRSSRHAVGEAAALMALEKVPTQPGLDVSLSSQRGKEPVSHNFWNDEFARVQEILSSGKGAQLFSAKFGEVSNVPRLADWLATKWAPTILRTYEISSIRVGGRPVYATQPSEDTIEIVWQQLVNFESVIVGKMTIQISEDGLVALRGPGDASRGFGEISRTPLPGEDVLVRRLAEGTSQAIEKGLATKPALKGQEEISSPVAVLKETKSMSQQEKSTQLDTATSTATGPRQSGLRRSTERARGKTKNEQ